MDNFVFIGGMYKGKTYKYVRTNHPDYFIHLLSKPAGKVYNEFDFIKYCIDYLKTDSSSPHSKTKTLKKIHHPRLSSPPPKKDYDKIIHQLCNSLMQKSLWLTYKTADKEYKIKYIYSESEIRDLDRYVAYDISFPEYQFCFNTIEKFITKINNNTLDPDFAKKVIVLLRNGDTPLEEL
uniref:Uncharacterized protein n=1 Tax=Megaviridae environmental sample TaxID=1737588 RepID=A0A5J6VLF6_9VIRU|nr:MAG: hypothetical protein [Megaviridae environmental sample]